MTIIKVFNILFVSEQAVSSSSSPEKERKSSSSANNTQSQSSKTEHVVHCQACARKRNHLLDQFVILNQYHLDDLKNVYDQFQLYAPSIVGLINNTSTTNTTTNTSQNNSLLSSGDNHHSIAAT